MSGQVELLAAKLIVGELPHAHAPWRLWTVGGLAGERGAVIAVIHHAVLDGIAGIRLLEHIVGTRSSARSGASTQPRTQIRRLASRANLHALGKLLREGLRPASQIGLNPRHTSRDRAVASFAVDLESVRKIEHTFGVTNNDVVLATAAGALRRLLARRDVDVDAARDVRAMVPVSRHRGRSEELSGNRVALLLAPLPVDLSDPVACLRRISSATRRLKGEHVASGGDLLIALSERTPTVLGAVLRIALRLRGFNVLVTNIPGPRTELALFGARLTGITPIVNLWPHHALGIAVASYAGTLTFGLHVDRQVIPNIAEVRDAMAASFAALLEAVGGIHPSPVHV